MCDCQRQQLVPLTVHVKTVGLSCAYWGVSVVSCSYVQRAVRLKEAASRWFFQQLIIGLDYCHRRGVVNRDIKLENTLLQVRIQRRDTSRGCNGIAEHMGRPGAAVQGHQWRLHFTTLSRAGGSGTAGSKDGSRAAGHVQSWQHHGRRQAGPTGAPQAVAGRGRASSSIAGHM
jgi:hypothetical protein